MVQLIHQLFKAGLFTGNRIEHTVPEKKVFLFRNFYLSLIGNFKVKMFLFSTKKCPKITTTKHHL